MVEKLTLHQTLHGYGQGHGLLASSLPLELPEKRLLDQLSDLSGYLPLGFEFESYYSGFLCGRFYALACTWLDRLAARSGTVLTHTLLIPKEAAATRSSLRPYLSLFKLPQLLPPPATTEKRPGERAATPLRDLEPYRRELSLTWPENEPILQLTIPQERVRKLYLARPERPLLWITSQPSEGLELAEALWRLRWPERRVELAFCTLALQMRSLPERPFELLCLPPQARGTFSAPFRTSGWWSGTELDPESRERITLPWVQKAGGAEGDAWMGRLRRQCLEQGLPLPSEAQLPILEQFFERHPHVRERLSTARGVLDMVQLLWPELTPTHPCQQRIFEALIEQQLAAPLEPRPFWELLDLLRRPRLLEVLQAQHEGTLASLLRGKVLEVLTDRWLRKPHETLQTRADLERCLSPLNLRALMQESRAQALASAEGELRERLVQVLLPESWQEPELLLELLKRLSSEERQLLLRDAFVSPETRPARLALALEVARRLLDPILILWVQTQHQREAEGLAEALHLQAEQNGSVDDHELLLGRVQPATAEAWCLAQTGRHVTWARSWLLRRWRELPLTPDEAFQRCQGQPQGRAFFHAFLAYLPLTTQREWLRHHPSETLSLVLATLREKEQPGPAAASVELAREALEQLDVQACLTSEVREALEAALARNGERGLEQKLARKVVPMLVPSAVVGKLSGEELLAWWRLEPIRRLQMQQSEYELQRPYPGGKAQPEALPRLAPVMAQLLEELPSAWGSWISVLLRPALAAVYPSDLRSCMPAIRAILDQGRHHELPLFASEVVAAARRTRLPETWSLVEQAFPLFYPALHAGRLMSYGTSWGYDFSWDKAKGWRHWLLDVWDEHHWPEQALLNILACEPELARRVFKRAVKLRRTVLVNRLHAHLRHHWKGELRVRTELLTCLEKQL